MSKKNSESVLKESLIELKQIQEMMKENSENQLKDILSESVKKGLKGLIAEANDFDEEEVDQDGEENKEEGLEDSELETGEEGAEGEESIEDFGGEESTDDLEDADVESELEDNDGDEDDIDFDQFKSDEDGEYDLTNVDNETLIKVFKKMNAADGVVVSDLGDGKLELKDDSADAEYVIDTEDVEDEDPMIEIDLGDEDNVMGEEMVTEEANEVGSEEEGEGMIDEKNLTQSPSVNRRAGVLSQTRADNAPGQNLRNGAQLVGESKQVIALKKAYGQKLKAINEENKQLKQALGLFRDKLKENAVLNNSLGKYVKLVTENTTSKDEKVNILGRFSKEVKTIEQGNSLFESIQKELNGKVNTNVMIDKQFSAESSKAINEQVLYQSKELSNIQSLMKRMNG